MYFKNNFTNSFLTTEYRTITLGIFLFGAVLFFLGILIFAYPILIAYFIGAIIICSGLSALFAGWRLWKFKNEIANLDKFDDESFRYFSPRMSKSHITYIRW